MKNAILALIAVTVLAACGMARAEWTVEANQYEKVTITNDVCQWYAAGFAALTERATQYGESADELRDAAVRGAVNTLDITPRYTAWAMLIGETGAVKDLSINKAIVDYAKSTGATIDKVVQGFALDNCKKRVGQRIEIPKRKWVIEDTVQM